MFWEIKSNKHIMKTSYCNYVVSEYDKDKWHVDMYVQNIQHRIPQFFEGYKQARIICELIEKESVK